MTKKEIKETIRNLIGLDISDPIEAQNDIKCCFEVEGEVIVSQNNKGNTIAYLNSSDSPEFELIEQDGIVTEVYTH